MAVTYLFSTVSGGKHLDDVLVAILVDDYLGKVCDQGVNVFPRARAVCDSLYSITTWETPTLFLVDPKEWGKVCAAVSAGLPDDEEIEDVYELSGWERADFDEQPEFLSERSECWTTALLEKSLLFQFYKKHEDYERETDRLNYSTIRDLLDNRNRSD
ncbi:MAG: hypothetical protein P1V36_01665 [Planctomycetota bacterium]|nr:hypothetical protein [Planctomycetota bacterium]